jgi:hypothetical protein
VSREIRYRPPIRSAFKKKANAANATNAKPRQSQLTPGINIGKSAPIRKEIAPPSSSIPKKKPVRNFRMSMNLSIVISKSAQKSTLRHKEGAGMRLRLKHEFATLAQDNEGL